MSVGDDVEAAAAARRGRPQVVARRRPRRRVLSLWPSVRRHNTMGGYVREKREGMARCVGGRGRRGGVTPSRTDRASPTSSYDASAFRPVPFC